MSWGPQKTSKNEGYTGKERTKKKELPRQRLQYP